MAGDAQASKAQQIYAVIPQRERPWLLPYNRRLRHLQGITLRNLTLVQNTSRPRGRTIDDEAVPSALKSPAKVLALRETRTLEHSRSSSDLRPITESAQNESAIAETYSKTDGSPKPKARSELPRMRRRSTMEWSGASPLERQHKLENVAARRMADTFFSLHAAGIEEPIYISEVVQRAMNPNFRFFELNSLGPRVTRLDEITVKFWAKSANMDNYQFLIELTINLRSLQFIGKALEQFHHPLPQNCIIFHMADGVYTSFTDLPPSDPFLDFTAIPPSKTQVSDRLRTSSYDALMRLSTLDDCIQDAIATRENIATDINRILSEHATSLDLINSVPEAKERLQTVETAVMAEKRRLNAARRKRDDLRNTISQRRENMRKGREVQKEKADAIPAAAKQLEKCKETLQSTDEEIRGQRRRVCEELQHIYPIEPIPNKSLGFRIKGIEVPNSDFDTSDLDPEAIAAGLGYTAQVVYLLSFYLGVPLPYPIQPRNSTSVVNDPISSMQTGSRTFPLYLKGAVRYRFEYAVFLLNKNIEIIANWLGLKLPDIRQTLPNLKYLLYVATAGEGELPARKAGGIRGLLRYRGSLAMQRRDSEDSVYSNQPEVDGKKGETEDMFPAIANGKAKANGSSKGGLATERALPKSKLKLHT